MAASLHLNKPTPITQFPSSSLENDYLILSNHKIDQSQLDSAFVLEENQQLAGEELADGLVGDEAYLCLWADYDLYTEEDDVLHAEAVDHFHQLQIP